MAAIQSLLCVSIVIAHLNVLLEGGYTDMHYRLACQCLGDAAKISAAMWLEPILHRDIPSRSFQPRSELRVMCVFFRPTHDGTFLSAWIFC